MPIDPIAQAILDVYNALPPPEEIGVEAARARSRAMSLSAPRGPDVGAVEEDVAHCAHADLPIRVYLPDGATLAPRPVVVYFHGGGFVTGDLDSGDAHCRMFCAGAGCVVVSVNYRHAPEHPFPAATEDAYAAVCWIADHLGRWNGDPKRVAVAGASAGATLATVATQLARDRSGPPICFQLLLVPGTDMEHDYPSYRETPRASGSRATRCAGLANTISATRRSACIRRPRHFARARSQGCRLPPSSRQSTIRCGMKARCMRAHCARRVCRYVISVMPVTSICGSGQTRTATCWPILRSAFGVEPCPR
jgi:acetyl esterase